MPEKLSTLTFGKYFNQKIEPGILPEKLIILTFGKHFNQIIDPGILSENLTILIFEGNFNQMIDSKMLPSNLIKINFYWMNLNKYDLTENYIDMINSIPNYYYVKIVLKNSVFGNNGLKWPIHIVDYIENEWPPEIYEIQGKYMHPIYNSITILINKETYQPYFSAKSTLK